MNLEGIEDIYELSQVQEGMLFHSLYAPGSGIYVEQVTMTMRGRLDVDAYCRAWQTIVDRHTVLRTSFHWEGVDRALQVVRATAEFKVTLLDWRDADPAEQVRRTEEFAQTDRMTAFDYTAAPLMRGYLIQLADDEWRFFWSFSHLLMDGWSFGLVFAELAELYTAYATGEQPQLSPALPYRDYLSWWKAQDRTETERFWEGYLAGYQAPDALEIGPVPDEPLGPDEPTHVFLPTPALSELMSEINDFAREHGLTLNTVMQGAWMIMLSRYLGRDDVLAGSTGTQRPATLPGAERIMGPMLATTPVRAKVTDDAELIGWLHELQTGMAQSREHADISLPDLRRVADLPGNQPLFELDLAFENVPVPDLRLADVEIVESTYDGRPHFPITMVVMPGDATPEPRLIYDRTRFSESAMRYLIDQFIATLVNLTRYPELRLGEIDIMPPEQWQQVIYDWNQPESQPAEPVLPELFARRATQQPTTIAVVHEDESVSYGELAARAHRLAHHLRAQGVQRGDRVGLCLQRSVDMVVGILGTLAAGAAYVPLDLSHPAERMRYILDDAQVVALVSHQATAGQLPQFSGSLVDLDRDADAIAAQPADQPDHGLRVDDLAYLVYTSGSTGRPKGVLVTHANVVRLVSGAGTRFTFTADDVWSLCHSYGFDVSVFEMWGAFANGARLVVASHDTLRNPEALRDLLATQQVTVLSQTPTAFRQLAVADEQRPDRLSALRYVVFAGEALDPPMLADWFARYGEDSPQLINMYGTTETTVHATFHQVRASEATGAIRRLVGRPLPDLRIYLLDRRMMPVPPGMTGEVYISGPGVTCGYQNQPELTWQHFHYDPYAGESGHRMYRSGDLGRWTYDGQLEFLGRADRQVKIRGFRVELGEVEAVLRQQPGIADAVVQTREIVGDIRLVAYVVPAAGASVAEAELREQVQAVLPEYMVPAHVMTLEALPVTPNGKIDTAALPAFDGSRPELARAYVAPRTKWEEAVAAVWQELLGVEKVGVHDDFFALGGHSLLATRVVFKLRAALGVEVPVRTLFDRPTLAAFAEAAERDAPRTDAAPSIPRQPRVAQRV